MKNNVIELYTYKDAEPFDYSEYNRRANVRFRNSQIRFWASSVIDAAATVSITGCTIFCCILAFSML